MESEKGKGSILQLTAVELFIFTLLFCGICLPASWIAALLFGFYEIFLIGVALILISLLDQRSSKGGAERTYLRDVKFWRIFRSYFSSELLIEDPDKFKESVPADQPVLFCIHPHGIIGFGVWANLLFASSEPNLTRQLPQLQSSRIVTLSLNFKYPIWSQFLTSIGFISSSAKSIQQALKKNKSVGIVIGGAEESLHSIPSASEILLYLKSRRGFIREALMHGTPLVPVFTFGEVDLISVYIPKEGSFLYRFQRWCKQILGFTTPIITSLHPKQIPLITVVGPPLIIPRISNPTHDDLEYFHSLYLNHLANFYYRNQFRDPVNPNRKLVMI